MPEVLHNSMENPDCAGSMSVLPESGRSEAAESGITRMSACIECEEQDLEKPDPGASFFQKIGWKQSSCEWKNLEYQPKHMMSEKWKKFVMRTRLEKASWKGKTRLYRGADLAPVFGNPVIPAKTLLVIGESSCMLPTCFWNFHK